MPLSRAERFRKRRLELTKAPPADGLHIYDPNSESYIFLTWAEVEDCARGTMETPEAYAAQVYGKPNWRSDPTYNMRRRIERK